MPKQIVFTVRGIEGDAFDSAKVFFPEELGNGLSEGIEVPTRRAGIVRKKPGRTTHHLVLTPEERIAEPEREIDVTVELYKDEALVATGIDTVAPPGPTPEDEEVCDPGCVTK